MKTSKSIVAIAALALLGLYLPNAYAGGPQVAEVKAGYLSCHVSSGFGIIVGSSRELKCTYTPSSGPPEYYNGEINKYGADIGYLQSGVMLWTVLAPSSTTGPGTLAGHYAGGTAGATLGLGAEVHALTGGMHNTIALQPIAIQGSTGLNVAAGVATMTLEWDWEKQQK